MFINVTILKWEKRFLYEKWSIIGYGRARKGH